MLDLKTLVRSGLALALCSLAACSSGGSDPAANPFLDATPEEGKADTGYLNPDGVEVEVDLEGDVNADASDIADGPASIAQFALTYLRSHGTFYLESLAEDLSQRGRVEWQIDGAWMTAEDAIDQQVPAAKLTHFRLRAINAVLLNDAKTGVQVGTEFTAPVPLRPFELYEKVSDACASYDADIPLGQDVYWYLWNPEKADCKADQTHLKITVSKMFAVGPTVYPEYDLLMADKKLTVVVLSGQIGHEELTDSDPGLAVPAKLAADLKAAGFSEIANAPLGTRLEKSLSGGRTIQVDLYDARVFSGLDDEAHFANFQKAISEHEIVVYDGHSMLGASDFWKRPTYPTTYQIFLYGGCLGYEYYVRPILEGKGGWAKLDIMTSVVEVSADANGFAAPALNKIFRSVENTPKASWKSLLTAVRTKVGDSTFGVSGVKDNCYTPSGSRCK